MPLTPAMHCLSIELRLVARGRALSWRWADKMDAGTIEVASAGGLSNASHSRRLEPRLSASACTTLSIVRRSSDAISQLNWVGDGAERLEAFTDAKDGHIAIVEHTPEN